MYLLHADTRLFLRKDSRGIVQSFACLRRRLVYSYCSSPGCALGGGTVLVMGNDRTSNLGDGLDDAARAFGQKFILIGYLIINYRSSLNMCSPALISDVEYRSSVDEGEASQCTSGSTIRCNISATMSRSISNHGSTMFS